MSEEKGVKSMARRDFFKKAGLGAGVVGVAAAGLSAGQARAGTVTKDGAAGYRETEHVKKYYQLAKF